MREAIKLLFPWGRIAADREHTAHRIAEIQAKLPLAHWQLHAAQRCLKLMDDLSAAPAPTTVRKDSGCPVGAAETLRLPQKGL